MDRRITLKKDDHIYLDREYIIIEDIGRGANSLVYKAYYKDNLGLKHVVLLKEFYPAHAIMKRNNENKLEALSDLSITKDKYIEDYKKYISLQENNELKNNIVNIFDIYHDEIYKDCIFLITQLHEGAIFSDIKESSLNELFTNMHNLALLIKKYHDKQYLHLDLKPDNILYLNEYVNHIFFFDLDTMILKNNIDKNTSFSYSKGYSPIELIKGDYEHIDNRSDIYSFSAILFEKLFNRLPTSLDTTSFSKYPFDSINHKDTRYSKKVYTILEDLFHKTLSSSYKKRINDINKVIEYLKELIDLTDLNKQFIIDHFNYHSCYFIGRENELNHIHKVLNEHHLLYLQGVGGIGKSELAKYYANYNKDYYGRIIFIRYENNFKDTLLDDGNILINNCIKEKEESNDDYFKRKYHIFKTDLKPNDLLIIDNYDIKDNLYEYIQELSCHIIITTRLDFSDYNLPVINLLPLQSKDRDDLFYTYNHQSYNDDQYNKIQLLFKYVDYHTMSIELLSKYLNYSHISLDEIVEQFKGLYQVQEKIKLRKDKNLYDCSASSYLELLFDLSLFNNKEVFIMSSLSLLGYSIIPYSLFLKWINDKESLDSLIEKGWIEFNNDCISLHQIILDLTYNKLKPNTHNCKLFVENIIDYINEESLTSIDKNNKKRLLTLFIERLSGEDDLYFNVGYSYCKKIYQNIDIIDKFINEGEKNKEYHYKQLLYLYKLRNTVFLNRLDCYDIEEYNSDFSCCIENNRKSISLICLFDKNVIKTLCLYLLYLKKYIDEICMHFMLDDTKRYKIIDQYYNYSLDVASMIGSRLEESDDYSVYHNVAQFYNQELLSYYFNEFYSDTDKVSSYITKAKEFEQLDDFEYITYEDLGDDLESAGKYEEAIRYYFLSVNYEDSELWVLDKIASLYIKLKEYKKAIEVYESLLEIEFCNPHYTFKSIIGVYALYDKTKLKNYILKDIEYQRNNNEDILLLEAYCLYSQYIDNYYEEEIEALYQSIKDIYEPKEFIDYDLYKANQQYKNNNSINLYYDIIFMYINDCDYNESLNLINNLLNNNISNYDNVKLLYYLSLTYMEKYENNLAMDYINQCIDLYKAYDINDYILYNEIYSLYASLYSDIDFDEGIELKKDIDYLSICLSKLNSKADNEKIKLLDETIDQYQYIDNYEMIEKIYDCYLFEVLDKENKELYFLYLIKRMNNLVYLDNKVKLVELFKDVECYINDKECRHQLYSFINLCVCYKLGDISLDLCKKCCAYILNKTDSEDILEYEVDDIVIDEYVEVLSLMYKITANDKYKDVIEYNKNRKIKFKL